MLSAMFRTKLTYIGHGREYGVSPGAGARIRLEGAVFRAFALGSARQSR
jgi:hypothetical protein